MARIFHTYDPYTSYGSYQTLSDLYSGSVYDPYSTSYNITLRDKPLCFFVDRSQVSDMIIKDNTGPFSVSTSGNNSNIFCSTTPRQGQTTEFIVLNGEDEYMYIVPDNTVDVFFGYDYIGYDPNTQQIVGNDEIDAFCSAMSSPISGEVASACVIQQKTGTVALQDVSVSQLDKELIFDGFFDILQAVFVLVFLVFFSVFVKKLLSSFWN